MIVSGLGLGVSATIGSQSRDVKGNPVKRLPDNFQWITTQILNRARHRCESCGVGNGWRGWWKGRTFKRCNASVRPPDSGRVIRVNLQIVALDHNLHNCDLMNHRAPAPPIDRSNLRAYCQRCAIRHEKTKPATRTPRKRRPQAEQLEFDL
jgi:hypothetical protein